MTLRSTMFARAGVTGLAIVLVASACGGSKSSGNSQASGGKQGGTLSVLMNSDFEHIDPGRIYVSQGMDASRLITRTLTTYKASAGKDGLQITPDLATDLGQKSSDCKTWTFHLKSGVKYEDGTDITSQDIKYGVERVWAQDVVSDGPQYPLQYIEGGDSYKGPYADPNGQVTGIETPDAKTIVFHLKKTVCDFNYTTTFSEFSPVPKAKDTKADYDNHPISTGPYQVQSYDRAKQLVLVRNKYWSKSTDSVRTALPDKIVFDMGLDENVIAQRLIQEQGNDRNAIMLDTNVPAALLPQTQAATVKSRMISGPNPYVYYIAINTQRVTNLAIRKALNTLVDKAGVIQTIGGPAAGTPTNAITSPTVASYKKFDVYHAGDHGDVAAAKKILADAGVQTPVTLTFAYRDRPDVAGEFQAFQRAWQQENLFKIVPDPIPTKGYFSQIGVPSSMANVDLIWSDWGADWPSGSTVIPPLFDGRQIQQQGNQVLSLLNDPTLNAQMDKAQEETDFAKSQKMWGDLDEAIQQQAAVIPWMDGKTNQLRGSNVTGYMHPFYSEFDLITVGLKG